MSRKFKHLKDKLLNPREYDVDISDPEEVRAWREFLKIQLTRKRPWLCDCCGQPAARGRDLHEGLVTRGDTQGLIWQPLIFSEMNSFLVLHEHHILRPMRRAHFLAIAERRYGVEPVKEWLESLPWKE